MIQAAGWRQVGRLTPILLEAAENIRRNQKTRNDEENVDADESSTHPFGKCVVENDRDDGDGSQAVDVGSIVDGSRVLHERLEGLRERSRPKVLPDARRNSSKEPEGDMVRRGVVAGAGHDLIIGTTPGSEKAGDESSRGSKPGSARMQPATSTHSVANRGHPMGKTHQSHPPDDLAHLSHPS